MQKYLADLLLDGLVLSVLVAHVLYAPYTKVEESFNLHAVHDILFHGLSPSALRKFDHFEFSGAVPRSFLGSLVLSSIVAPVLRLVALLGVISSKQDVQTLLRLVMTLLNGIGLCILHRATSSRFGNRTGAIFALLSVTQYHLPFWMGRTLPNMFALLPVNCSLYLWIGYIVPTATPGFSLELMIGLLTFAAVVLRGELVLLLLPICSQLLITRPSLCLRMLKAGLCFGLLSLGATIVIDSYFWDTWPLWPEFNGVVFNVLQGQSANWGVSPMHSYFSSHLPKMLLGAFPLCFVGIAGDSRCIKIVAPGLVFVGLMSCLGHKEWRFIVYTIPLLNICASRGATILLRAARGRHVKALATCAIIGAVAFNSFATIFFSQASHLNYPGGQALQSIHHLVQDLPRVNLYLDNLAVQTGASLFIQERRLPSDAFRLPTFQNDTWTYNRSEGISTFSDFTHVICEDVSSFLSPSTISETLGSVSTSFKWSVPIVQAINHRHSVSDWRPLAVIIGYDGWILDKLMLKPKLAIKLWILEKTL